MPNAAISPFGNPFDKILRQIAHSEQSSSHTICRKISLSVSPSSAHVRRRRRILTFLTVWAARQRTAEMRQKDYLEIYQFLPIICYNKEDTNHTQAFRFRRHPCNAYCEVKRMKKKDRQAGRHTRRRRAQDGRYSSRRTYPVRVSHVRAPGFCGGIPAGMHNP